MQLTENDVIAWLREQPDKRFFEVIYEAAEGRGPDEYDRGWLESHVILGYAWREIPNDGTKPWSVQLVALPSGKQHPGDIVCEAGAHVVRI